MIPSPVGSPPSSPEVSRPAFQEEEVDLDKLLDEALEEIGENKGPSVEQRPAPAALPVPEASWLEETFVEIRTQNLMQAEGAVKMYLENADKCRSMLRKAIQEGVQKMSMESDSITIPSMDPLDTRSVKILFAKCDLSDLKCFNSSETEKNPTLFINRLISEGKAVYVTQKPVALVLPETTSQFVEILKELKFSQQESETIAKHPDFEVELNMMQIHFLSENQALIPILVQTQMEAIMSHAKSGDIFSFMKGMTNPKERFRATMLTIPEGRRANFIECCRSYLLKHLTQ